ncbi:glycosyltransferase involved in cell wall biosynthesis [Micromonospora profundi]|uniref:glycosyltransferase family 4 protein n=1 Tax=Micromonospora profundi TaxID=1420889 RepID=UPI00143BBA9B|nr:glycosyltransferase family 4 protein [Micromonospora profundi]NJC13548.1 glycosyltransferase involved in cell wall biosynthesis [Micromonospora profundi]
MSPDTGLPRFGGGRSGQSVPRVAFVTQWFAPEPTTTPVWIARSLSEQDLRVEVLTGVPNYPTGNVHDGYSSWRRTREVHQGVPVRRVPLYPSHDQSAVRRVANYASYAASAATLGASVLRSADVAVIYSTPATAAAAGIYARLRWGLPYVLMVMDVWPDSVFATGFLTGGAKRRIAEPALTWYTEQTYRWASHITATSPGMRDALVSRGVPEDKVSVVYSWTDEKVMRPSEPDRQLRASLGLSDEFVLMYGGNHGAAQNLDVAVRAMGELRDLPIHLVLVGDGIEKVGLRSLASDLGLRSVHFLDPVEPERMPAIMAAADMQLVALADEELFRFTLPSKVQSILACAQPIVTCAPGDAARVVHEAGAGFSSPAGDPHQLAKTIRQAAEVPRGELRSMGRAGYAYYRSHLSEEINARALAGIVRASSGRRRRGRGTGGTP